jgi:hypothetical protein
MLLKVGLYSRNSEAHFITVSFGKENFTVLGTQMQLAICFNDSSLYEEVGIHRTRGSINLKK